MNLIDTHHLEPPIILLWQNYLFMGYQHQLIDQKWQKRWIEEQTFGVERNEKPKYYVLDMFPYPSGAGLHVGHPLGYIASDIFARYKRNQGFNVLHPIGYDSFGLPAEQYAIETGQHPQKTTQQNISIFEKQLKKIGLSFDWERMVSTCSPDFYKHTQRMFLLFYDHWYNKISDKSEPISKLISEFETQGNQNVNAVQDEQKPFSADEWNAFSEEIKLRILLNYRMAFLKEIYVNWCPKLGCVLSNDEVKNGYSIRGGHPVYQKKMKQWMIRISAYAPRLLEGLERINFSHSLTEIQKHWIGKSLGANVHFPVVGKEREKIKIFTTRPDTIFGVTFMVLAPESELVELVIDDRQKETVEAYLEKSSRKNQRERMENLEAMTGCFTGSYALNPITKKEIPIWISDYVLADYGTGAIMAVPGSDERDYRFATQFGLEIVKVIKVDDEEKNALPCVDSKDGTLINSGVLNGKKVKEAIETMIQKIEKERIGIRAVNYRLRDAIYARQRYWGEPIPVYFKGSIPYPISPEDMPLELPKIEKYLPTESGEPPLARAKEWKQNGHKIETSTMPGWAGSSWYFIRYMDPKNPETIANREDIEYWNQVDLYVGGVEHATGHLIYARFWTKFLYDIGEIPFDEPFKKLINQGMIQGKSAVAYKLKEGQKFISSGLKKKFDVIPVRVPILLLKNEHELDMEALKRWAPQFEKATFETEGGKFLVERVTEKMSKSLHNVVNPDSVIEKYGADTFRLYEMFLGPIEYHKPWDMSNIEGTFRFVKKFWNLIHPQDTIENLKDENPSKEELKILHKAIKAITTDIERFSLNTCVSHFMICVNELSAIKCKNKEVLKQLTVLLSPFAPHISEEVWEKLGEKGSICYASYPKFNPEFVKESVTEYPISFNGKVKLKLEIDAEMDKGAIEDFIRNNEQVSKKIQGKTIKKVIVVPQRIVNIVF